jgi:2-polyprenyl-3-methyl-5-hydroxy-6-metoxy-1,4-benzoquinol methylase
MPATFTRRPVAFLDRAPLRLAKRDRESYALAGLLRPGAAPSREPGMGCTSDRGYDAELVQPKARGSVHAAVLEWFADKPRGRVLDAPAGYGHLSLKLHRMGFAVTCGEIEPEIFKAPGLACVSTDLNQRIDAPDGQFDYTCCIDGLEHMTDPYRAVAEFARVLKPGGYAVFSIPNYSNIE